ncbi:hypothetical protein F5X98DRAFT_97112 [Xylaria grammica]|nr:hypothetical protein F5X98DRAFT_97112 [Xylaria grammica]
MGDLVRSCLPPPRRSSSEFQRNISFRHPAYPDTANALLSLSAVDPPGGIHYDVAIVACGIVAGNRWHHAWFALRRDDDQYQPVDRPDDNILPWPPHDQPYYFFVGPDPEERYAVVPSFENWRFPHNDLPTPWRDAFSSPSDNSLLDADAQQAVRARDRACRVTGFLEATEAAHLVPSEASGWFEANRMERYCRVLNRTNPIDDDANMMLLRRDLHFMFDRRRFVLVPKNQHEFPILHVLIPGGLGELHTLYHNRPLQPSPSSSGVCPEFLFARFAWAIFSDEIYRFLKQRLLSYTVLALDVETGQRVIKDVKSDAVQAHIFPRPTRNRSVSPQKRKRSTAPVAADDYRGSDYNGGDWSEEGNSDSEAESSSESFRGRSRRRSVSASSPPRCIASYTSASLSTLGGNSPQTLPDQFPVNTNQIQETVEEQQDMSGLSSPLHAFTGAKLAPTAFGPKEKFVGVDEGITRIRTRKRRRTDV